MNSFQSLRSWTWLAGLRSIQSEADLVKTFYRRDDALPRQCELRFGTMNTVANSALYQCRSKFISTMSLIQDQLVMDMDNKSMTARRHLSVVFISYIIVVCLVPKCEIVYCDLVSCFHLYIGAVQIASMLLAGVRYASTRSTLNHLGTKDCTIRKYASSCPDHGSYFVTSCLSLSLSPT